MLEPPVATVTFTWVAPKALPAPRSAAAAKSPRLNKGRARYCRVSQRFGIGAVGLSRRAKVANSADNNFFIFSVLSESPRNFRDNFKLCAVFYNRGRPWLSSR